MARSFDKGPFSSFKLQADSQEIEWTGLKFSPDGKVGWKRVNIVFYLASSFQSILISTNESMIKLIDSYNGATLQVYTLQKLLIVSFSLFDKKKLIALYTDLD